MRDYFITGASGAIGSALVPILLSDASNRVSLLLRARSPTELNERLDSLCSFWQIDARDAALRGRLKGLRGDVTLAAFGLAQEDYRELCASTSHIVHSAGNVRMNLPIEQARLSAVSAAQNILALAHAAGRLEKIEFVSTVGVGGRTHGELPEEWLSGRRVFHNTYEQAKAEAEDVVRLEVDHGMPLTVHRPSMVVGDSTSGRIIHFQVFYHLCEFLSGRRTLGLSPDFGHARLDIVPADYVARCIAWSSTTTATSGKILHACSGPTSALLLAPLRERVRQTFASAGRRVPPLITLPASAFSALVRALAIFLPSDAKRAIRTLPVFLEYLATDQSFANRQTLALTSSAGLALPSPECYLDRVLGYYLEQSAKKNSLSS
ncbi:MAG: SDR family oxidoreductase [Candidatus Accumulibacter sp.]|uniref:SDR family oxidoreductase n=1 Tax=Accumulibacter sp. TaxID=2053492 RepID=UPI00287A3FA2|nr:SDR family oxidoreductase [Accumulibacter sp.]MDS4013407.1 SDR family oxidoreductase [Accumulibacter sp.]